MSLSLVLLIGLILFLGLVIGGYAVWYKYYKRCYKVLDILDNAEDANFNFIAGALWACKIVNLNIITPYMKDDENVFEYMNKESKSIEKEAKHGVN